MNLASDRMRGVADMLAVMGQTANIFMGTYTQQRQLKLEQLRMEMAAGREQEQADRQDRLEARQAQWRQEDIERELLGNAEKARTRTRERGEEAADRDRRDRESRQHARDMLELSKQPAPKTPDEQAQWIREATQENLKFAADQEAEANQLINSLKGPAAAVATSAEEARGKFAAQLHDMDWNPTSPALKRLFKNKGVQDAMKKSGWTQQDVMQFAEDAVASGATGTFSAVAQRLPDAAVRAAFLSASELDDADTDWAARAIPFAEAYHKIHIRHAAMQEHIDQLGARAVTLAEATAAMRQASDVDPDAAFEAYIGALQVVPDPDSTRLGASDEELAADGGLAKKWFPWSDTPPDSTQKPPTPLPPDSTGGKIAAELGGRPSDGLNVRSGTLRSELSFGVEGGW